MSNGLTDIVLPDQKMLESTRNGIPLKTESIASTWPKTAHCKTRCVLSQSDTASKRGMSFPDIVYIVLTFEYSERKWKEKLKEWRFEKNISGTDMSIIVAKAEKRVREEGKETVFFHVQSEITRERIEQFKRRKTTKAVEEALPSAGK
jgi:hypothetical protein